MKFAKALLAILVYGVTLLGVYYLHVLFLNVDVVFYSAIFDGLVASVLVGALLFWIRPFQVFSHFEKGLLICITLLLGYSFAISVPTVIDRSLSFYILEKLDQRGGSLPYSSFEDVFKNEYMREHHLVDIRLTEQMASGTITMEKGTVALTPRGKALATFSRFFRLNLLPKHRLIMGTYSDVLTDPFRDSQGASQGPTPSETPPAKP